MTEREVADALRIHFNAPEYAFLTQVRNHTGYHSPDGTRNADALAFGLWQSRGHYLHGIEIKVSRGDLLSELKNPKKAEAIGKYCNFWWIATPAGAVLPEELPARWGLIHIKDGKNFMQKQAIFEPEALPLTTAMVCGIMRKVSDTYVPQHLVDGMVEASAEQKAAAKLRSMESEINDAQRLRTRVQEFQEKSGIKIDSWTLGDVAEAVRSIRMGTHIDTFTKLARLRTPAEGIIQDIDEVGTA